MKTNLDKVMERGELVDSLHDKTGMCYPFPCFFVVVHYYYYYYCGIASSRIRTLVAWGGLSIYCRGCSPKLTCHVSIDR